MRNLTEFETFAVKVHSVWSGTLAILTILPNLILIFLWLKTTNIRNVPINLALINQAISDIGFSISFTSASNYISFTSDTKLCYVFGFFGYIFSLFSTYLPAFLAVQRQILVTKTSETPAVKILSTQLGSQIFVTINWLYVLSVQMVFLILDQYGFDATGTCGMSPEMSQNSAIFYNAAIIGPFMVSVGVTMLSCNAMLRHIKKLTNTQSDEHADTKNDVESVVKITKYLTIGPLICATPLAASLFLKRLNVIAIPNVIVFIAVLPYYIPPMLNPFFVLFYLKPFHNSLGDTCEKSKVAQFVYNLLSQKVFRIPSHRTNRILFQRNLIFISRMQMLGNRI